MSGLSMQKNLLNITDQRYLSELINKQTNNKLKGKDEAIKAVKESVDDPMLQVRPFFIIRRSLEIIHSHLSLMIHVIWQLINP